MKAIAVGIFLVLIIICGCTAPQYRSPGFGDVDIDGDGVVTWPEYQKSFPGKDKDVFLVTDENEDTTLDQGEFDAGIGVHW